MSDPRDWRTAENVPAEPTPGVNAAPATGPGFTGPTGPTGPTDRPLPPHLDPRRGAAPSRGVERPARHVVPSGRVRRPRRLARILSWLAVITSVSVLAVATTGYVLVNHYNGNIQRLHVFDTGRADAPPAAPRNAENFLIVGSDSRGNLKPGQGVQGVGSTYVKGQRSDTVILAHLYGGNGDKVQLVSFPRDSVVEIPTYTDALGKIHQPQSNRINYAFSEGGPNLLVRTVQDLTHVRIDHYLQVDFNGFQSMVDKLGGVDVCLAQPAKDHFSGINLSAGKHHVNGAVALSFVRQRHGLTNGDIDRIKRQQQFIGAMVRKVLSAGTLANPFKLNGFLDVATSSLKADEKLDFGTMQKLALRLRNLGAGNVIFATIPITNLNASDPRLGSVVLVDKEKAATLFDAIRRDEAPGGAKPKPKTSSAPTQPLIVAPGAIRVTVFNASGINGLGRKAYGELAAVGFQAVGVPETRGTGVAGTTVLYGPTKADSARTVAAAIPGATTQLDPSLGRVLQVVVGTSYTAAHNVTITAGSLSASPQASPSPKVVTALDNPCAA